MENKIVKCGKLNISNKSSFTLIAGPCQLENEEHALNVAIKLKEITNKLNLGLIYKTSFDKANRTSLKGKRGAGLEASLPIFDKIRKDLDIPVLGTLFLTATSKSEEAIKELSDAMGRSTRSLTAAARSRSSMRCM